jgi:hypothetical protein
MMKLPSFLILDRNQGEIRSMDYTELNHVLIDMAFRT